VNKVAGEQFHILYNNVYGIRACVLRSTNTIGPRMRIKDARQTFLGIWIRLLLEGKPFEVWGGEQLRDFTYVEDAVEAFLLAAASDAANGRIFNLGGDCVISLKALAEMLIEVNSGGHYDIRPFPPERKQIDIGDFYSDFTQISSALGWKPKVALREALSRTLAFYGRNLKHYV
jgi:UDP-glucose 4-epimerase